METNIFRAKKALLLHFALLLPLLASAQIEIDGIYYNLDTDTKQAKVTSGGQYYGSIIIPATITYDGVEYSVTSIEDRAFFRRSVKTITLPRGLTSIGNNAFQECSSLTSITLPEGLTSIGDYAFRECKSLTSITLPEGITSIGQGSFSYCYRLTSITLPEGLTSIGDNAFIDCESLTSITIPESVTTIKDGAFQDCSSLTSINIPQGVTSIESDVFHGCSSLTSITLPEGLTSIRTNVFQGCSSLTSITIPKGVTSIEKGAFANCSKLKEVTLGKGLKNIASGSFSGSNSIEKITIHATQPPATDGYIFSDATYEDATLYVPQGCVSKYQVMIGWSRFYNILANELVTEITLSQQTATITEGNTLTLIATVVPDNAADHSVVWSCSDEAIATVDTEGKVTAIAPGIATITAIANDGSEVSASCVVTVKARRVSVVIVDPHTEDRFMQDAAEEYIDITYIRTFSSTNWQALYVPFEIPVTEEFSQNYEVAYFNDIHSYDEVDAAGNAGRDGVIDRMSMEVLTVQPGETLNANYPYLIRAKNTDALEMELTIENATLHKTVETTVSCSSVFMRFDVTGIYTTQTAGELKGEFDVYAMSGGGWKQALNDSQQLKPFRLYLKLTSIDGSPVKVSEAAMRAISIRVDGEEGITQIDNTPLIIDNEETIVYDVQGRRVVNPNKGMYIVNGKKVTFK